MIFFGHLGMAIFLGAILSLPLIFVATGVILPDLVDKVLFILGYLPCGRFFGHTIFFGPVAAFFVYLITRRKDISLAILFGCYIHLLGDIRGFIPWFYPVVNYAFDCKSISIAIGPFEIITESVGVFLLVVTFLWKSKIAYLRKKINYGLKYVSAKIN